MNIIDSIRYITCYPGKLDKQVSQLCISVLSVESDAGINGTRVNGVNASRSVPLNRFAHIRTSLHILSA